MNGLNENRKLQGIFLFLLTVTTIVYMVWRFGWTIPTTHGVVSMIFAVILLTTEVFGVIEMLLHFYLNYDTKSYRPKPVKWDRVELPEVDVFVTTYSEPVELLRETLTACRAMEYDDTSKVHIHLCDDGARAEMKELAAELGVNYLFREKGANAKAGNLNEAMKQTSAPLIAVFDADMCPKPEFLLTTVPYFLFGKKNNIKLSSKIGFVQTPQCFKNADLFQKAFNGEGRIPNEQDYFYMSLEPARNKSNSVIFGGSNTVLLREALEKAGGFVTGTLTEDFATGIEIQKKGYTCFAIPDELTLGLVPESLGELVKQRSRWARGCIQSGRKTKFIRSRSLTLRQKLSYLISISYWYAPVKRLVYILSPLMYAVFNVTVMECSFLEMLALWLPMYLLAVIGIRLFSNGIRTARWSDIYEICLFPFLMLPVLGETFGFSIREFKVTDKSGKSKWNPAYTLPFLVLIALSAYGIFNIVNRCIQEHTTIYLFLLFWLIYNTYYLMLALVFVVSGRKPTASEAEFRIVHTLNRSKVEMQE